MTTRTGGNHSKAKGKNQRKGCRAEARRYIDASAHENQHEAKAKDPPFAEGATDEAPSSDAWF